MPEHIDDLQFNGLKIILSDELPAFTTDAVLLAGFCHAKDTDRVADLGSGSGVISLLLHGRCNSCVTGFELNASLCDMANRSAEFNGVSECVRFINADYTQAYHNYNGTFHVCVANPPYFNAARGLTSPDPTRAMTRTFSDTDIFETCRAAMRLLRSGGDFYVCYPAGDCIDLFCALRETKLEPKEMRFVAATPEKPPYLVLVRARKDGGVGVSIADTLTVCDGNGGYTDEVKLIYHMG